MRKYRFYKHPKKHCKKKGVVRMDAAVLSRKDISAENFISAEDSAKTIFKCEKRDFRSHNPEETVFEVKRSGSHLVVVDGKKAISLASAETMKQLRDKISQRNFSKIRLKGLSKAQVGRVVSALADKSSNVSLLQLPNVRSGSNQVRVYEVQIKKDD